MAPKDPVDAQLSKDFSSIQLNENKAGGGGYDVSKEAMKTYKPKGTEAGELTRSFSGTQVTKLQATYSVATRIIAKAQEQEAKQEEGNAFGETFRNYVDSNREDMVRKTYTEMHTNQTVEYGRKQRERHLAFKKCLMTVWDMGHYLDNIHDESDPDTDMSQLAHALQTAETCRKAYPGEEYDWMHVCAFIHDFGKILLVDDDDLNLSPDPQWAVVGDNYPVGCAYSDKIVYPDTFTKCPDLNDERYNTKLGMYKEGCGLKNVQMSWGHDEYIYQIAKRYSTIPEEGLYMLRYHSFYPWHDQGAYMYLCDEKDKEMLKWVQIFNKFDLYSKTKDVPVFSELAPYYKAKIEKYFGKDPIWW